MVCVFTFSSLCIVTVSVYLTVSGQSIDKKKSVVNGHALKKENILKQTQPVKNLLKNANSTVNA